MAPLFDAFTAALAAWFLVPEDEATDSEIAAMREKIRNLRLGDGKLTER